MYYISCHRITEILSNIMTLNLINELLAHWHSISETQSSRASFALMNAVLKVVSFPAEVQDTKIERGGECLHALHAFRIDRLCEAIPGKFQS